MRTATLCRYGDCPEITTQGYCDEHRFAAPAPAPRPPAALRGYGGAWSTIRRRVLEAAPFCTFCSARATQVDHIVPLSQGGTHDLQNLRPVCARCHSRITASGLQRDERGRWVAG